VLGPTPSCFGLHDERVGAIPGRCHISLAGIARQCKLSLGHGFALGERCRPSDALLPQTLVSARAYTLVGDARRVSSPEVSVVDEPRWPRLQSRHQTTGHDPPAHRGDRATAHSVQQGFGDLAAHIESVTAGSALPGEAPACQRVWPPRGRC
jgi:hypothetical protein